MSFDDLIDANRQYQQDFPNGDAAKVPTKQLVVLTCMDARVDGWRAFGLLGGQAHVLRNAGGRVSEDVVRSIAISTTALGTKRVAVVHHTDCGMLTDDEEGLRTALRDRGLEVADDTPLLTFSDEEASVREDLALLRDHPMVPSDLELAGFLYDVDSGELRPVE